MPVIIFALSTVCNNTIHMDLIHSGVSAQHVQALLTDSPAWGKKTLIICD